MARILLVEDQPIILQLTSRILELNGHTVTPSATRAAAAEALDAPEPFDLVLTDMNLPDGTAGDLLPHLAASSRHRPDRHVRLRDGEPRPPDRRWTTVGLLQKPFAPADLSAAVEAALRRMERTSE